MINKLLSKLDKKTIKLLIKTLDEHTDPACTLTTKEKNREIRHAMYGENARKAIGKLYSGIDLHCLNKGQFSIINVIEEVLEQTGQADVIISTWTASGAEIKKAEQFLNNGKINRLNFIVDRSFKTRQPRYYKTLKEKFGNIIHETNSHSKFILIKNDKWDIVIETSMNLNENKRMEMFKILDSKKLYNYYADICMDIMAEEAYSYEAFKLLGEDEKYNQFLPADMGGVISALMI